MSESERNCILFDDPGRDRLLPFTFIRPVSEIRMGILTFREKWERRMNCTFSWLTRAYLQEKYPLNRGEENLLINGSVSPNSGLLEEIAGLSCGDALFGDGTLIAACVDRQALEEFDAGWPEHLNRQIARSPFFHLMRPWELFSCLGEELNADFALLTSGRTSAPLSDTNRLICSERIFAEDGVKMEYALLNASPGPIYLAKDSEVMEGALIRGSFFLGTGAKVKMGARIYGPTSVGPYSKIGGEVTNSVLFSYTNKVHEGYVGNSVLGDWCNIGADSNTSNLKNNYTPVKIWDYMTGRAEETGLQFGGLLMGDYSRCGINTMFNTGTVVGISSNIYGAGFPGNFIPSFSWGGAAGFETYRVDRAIETIARAMTSKGLTLLDTDRKIIASVFGVTDSFRTRT